MCLIDLSLSPCSLAEYVTHSLQVDILSSRVAVDDRLRLLSASLTVGMETLQHLTTQLSDAAQQTTQTHTLLDVIHSRFHQYQVKTHTYTPAAKSTPTHTRAHTPAPLLS